MNLTRDFFEFPQMSKLCVSLPSVTNKEEATMRA